MGRLGPSLARQTLYILLEVMQPEKVAGNSSSGAEIGIQGMITIPRGGRCFATEREIRMV
jgi:hypothetical protein